MKTSTAFVVVGERGEYSDHELWLVKGFANKSEAEKLVRLLNEEMVPHAAALRGAWERKDKYEVAQEKTSEYILAAEKKFKVQFALTREYPEKGKRHWFRDDAMFAVHELPWDTRIAGGLKK